jgi:flagellar basal-body rod modification protein FlgD
MTTPVSSTSSTNNSTTTTSSTSSNSEVSQQQFLTILLAQMKNQDPLNPMDDTQFITQLAQFSSLEQLEKVNENLSAGMYLDIFSQAASMMGRNIDAVDPTTGDTISGEVSAVSFEDGNATLTVGDETVGLGYVTRIY